LSNSNIAIDAAFAAVTPLPVGDGDCWGNREAHNSKEGVAESLNSPAGEGGVQTQLTSSSTDKSNDYMVMEHSLAAAACVDKGLAVHTQALRDRLAAAEATRGLLWATLLCEALM
jgi:hypothetical protein